MIGTCLADACRRVRSAARGGSRSVTGHATSVPPAAANTKDVLPGAPGVSVTPAVDALAVGVAEVAKKPDG